MEEDELIGLQRTDGRVRPLQAGLCAFMPLLWAGVPFAAMDMPLAFGNHATSLLVIGGMALYLLQLVMNRQSLDVWVLAPILMIVAMISATMISSTFYFRNPMSDWVPALSNYSPIAFIFLARSLGLRISELLVGFLLASGIAATLVVVDHFSHIPMMDQFSTYSGFDTQNRRVLLIKNDLGVGIMICVARLAMVRRVAPFFGYSILLGLLGFDLLVASEVRLVIGAVLLAASFFIFFGLPTVRKLIILIASCCLLLGAGQFVFGKYIDRISGTTDYATEDSSVTWRIITVNHYRKYFEQSNWVGFGIMSTSPTKDNILTYSYFKASRLYGDQGFWGIYIADASLFGALFQFGIPGLLIAVFMSLFASGKMIAVGRRSLVPSSKDLCAIGFFMLFLVISPWPLNFFGLSWAIMSGSMLWALAARASTLDLRVRKEVAYSGYALEPERF